MDNIISDHDTSRLYPSPTTWYWDENSNELFYAYLQKEDVKNELNKILGFSDGDEMAGALNSLLAKVAEKCGINKKKRQSRSKHPYTSPWYDKECVTLKNKIRHHANLIKKHPLEGNLTESLYTPKKQYNKIVKKKEEGL